MSAWAERPFIVLNWERTRTRFGLGQTVSVLLEYVDVAQGRVWLGDLRVLAEPGSQRIDQESD